MLHTCNAVEKCDWSYHTHVSNSQDYPHRQLVSRHPRRLVV
jgi:hypothetical protein